MSTSNHALRIAVLLAALVSLSAATARAQIWQGPASLEIKAEGKGASVAGANVELLYLALDPPAGPPAVQLDSRGRAVVNGLAEGMWRVSVSHEGFMTYQAEVDVRRDDKPKLAATFQQNVPGAVHMMQVKVARAKPSGPTALPPPPQIAEQRPAPRPAEPPVAAPVPVAPAPTPTPAPVQEATPQPPAEPQPKPAAPTPAPREVPQPAPSAPQPAPPAPQPAQPAPPQPVQPTPQPAQPAPQTAPPAPPSTPPAVERPTTPPVQAPAPMPAPPQPAPTPAPAPAPGGSVLHRSYADRTCYECKPGESSLSAERVVSRGAGCGAAVRDLLAQGGDPAGLPDGCAVFRLTLPPGARYTGYRYEIQERSGSVDCLAGRDCPGGGRWPVDPALARSAAGTTVSAAFENPGSGDERRAILTVYYTER